MNHYRQGEPHTNQTTMEQSQPPQTGRRKQQNQNYNATQQQQQQQQQQETQTIKLNKKFPNAHVKIIEQPASKAIRFRYECERRSAGSLVGANSTSILKTYPTIEVVGYKGRGVVVVSCVNKDAPYRPHPYSLTGKEGCRKGVCTVEINSGTMRYVFTHLGIQCVRKKDIEEALKLREEIRVDPFKTGFEHRGKISKIDLNALRLCFQVFIEDDNGRFTIPLAPIVSEPILNRNSTSELTISEMCSSGTVLGNTQIMLLCEKVVKDDIVVRFFEEKDGQCNWEAFGNFLPCDVHKQTSIRLKTPRYHNIYITEPLKVNVQLKRPSDGEVSEPWQFTYEPLDTKLALMKRKANNGKGPTDRMHEIPKQATSSNLDITELMSNIKDILPANNYDPYPTSGQMTPSPQPTSPPAFNGNHQNSQTLHNKVINNNTPPKSPHDEFVLGAVECVGASAAPNLPTTTKPMENLNEYNNSVYGTYEVGQQPLQQPTQSIYATQIVHQNQQPVPPPPLQNVPQQQNYGGNIYYNANTWDEGYANILRDVNNGNLAAFTAAALNNFYSSNSYSNMQQNVLGYAPTAGMSNMAQPSQWNFPPNNNSNMQATRQQWQQWTYNDHHQQQQNLQVQQQVQQQGQPAQHTFYQQNPHPTKKFVGASKDYEKYKINNFDVTPTEVGERRTTIGNLLNLDSEELIKVTCVDQDMLPLTTEELQLSNLYIST